MREDEGLADLVDLDPTRSEAPPPPGSPRHTTIWETTMTMTDVAEPTRDATRRAPASAPRPRRRGLTAAAAVVAVVAIGAVVLRPGQEPSAEAAVTRAAAAFAEVTSVRARVHIETDADVSDVTIAYASEAWEIVQEMRPLDGGEASTDRWVVIGGTEYHTTEVGGSEETIVHPVEPNYQLAPFGEASAAVVRAALTGASVDEVGPEEVRGTETIRYRLHLAEAGTSALAELPRAQRGWFDLEFDPTYHWEDVEIDLWIADDLIRRITVMSPSVTFAAEYFDFGRAIAITPPPPPYVESGNG